MSQRERRFLVLHGAENRRPPEHWQHWLAEQLRRRREVVLYPQLPDPDNPSLGIWLELVRAELAQLGGGERIVVCHSLATLAWLHLASQLETGQRVNRVLLVSPPSPDCLWPEIIDFQPPANLPPDLLSSASDSTRIVYGENDPYCPSGADHLYAEPLKLPADLIADGGHLGADNGYGPWPSLLAWCLQDTVPVRG